LVVSSSPIIAHPIIAHHRPSTRQALHSIAHHRPSSPINKASLALDRPSTRQALHSIAHQQGK